MPLAANHVYRNTLRNLQNIAFPNGNDRNIPRISFLSHRPLSLPTPPTPKGRQSRLACRSWLEVYCRRPGVARQIPLYNEW